MSDEQYTHTGRVMFLLVWIILFAGLFFFFYYYDKSDSVVLVTKPGELAVSADSEGHYRMIGKINGYAVKFLVDTGATLVAIPQNVAEQLHIVGRYPVTISTANGVTTGTLTRLDNLSFGEFNLKDIKAVIIASNDDTILLGMNVLSRFNIVQDDHHLILKKSNKK